MLRLHVCQTVQRNSDEAQLMCQLDLFAVEFVYEEQASMCDVHAGQRHA